MEKKKVFVAASITGGRETLRFVKFIVKYLEEQGCEVPSVHNAGDDPIKTFVDKIQDPTATDDNSFRDWDNRWIDEADLFVAEVSTPSHGVGGEFEHCRLKERMGLKRTPMLCVSLDGAKVSPYLTGISEEERAQIEFRVYRTEIDLVGIIDGFLEAHGAADPYRATRQHERARSVGTTAPFPRD